MFLKCSDCGTITDNYYNCDVCGTVLCEECWIIAEGLCEDCLDLEDEESD